MFAATLMAGCAAAGEDKELVEPQLGKADSLSSVTLAGTLNLDAPMDNEFTEDLTFHGYRFYTQPTARITAEVTQAGTSRGLDTTMFLYGEKPDGDWERIAFDDDDGYGALSKLTKLSVEGFTSHVLVIGTANGLGRGNYRVQVSCTNGQCLADNPIDTSSCDSTIKDLYTQCVDDMLDNADWDWDDPAERMSVEYCEEEGTEEYAGYDCAGGGSSPVCRITAAELRTGIEACTPEIKDRYHVYDGVMFRSYTLSAPLESAAETLAESANATDGYASLTASLTDSDDTEAIAYAIRENEQYGNALEVGNVLDRNTYRALAYIPEDTVDAIEDVHGTEYRAVRMNGSYYVAAGAEEWTSIEVLHYPADGLVFIITQTAGE